MNYAAIKTHDIANGPGVRVSLYVSGCSHHCEGCFNPETWDPDYGKLFDENAEKEIIDTLEKSYIKGFSLLGGEPFDKENTKVLAEFIKRVKEHYPEKTVWCYTGYDFENDLLARTGEFGDETAEMLAKIDVLVDGEFQLENKIIDLRFRGSTNQRIIDVQASLADGNVVEWTDAWE